MTRFSSMTLLALVLLLGATGCENSQEFRELREGQRELRAKLDSIEKKLDMVAARPAGGGGQAAGQPDPNKVYDIPVGASPVKGPAGAPVTLIEFADYQCPFCARNLDLVKQVMAAYPTQLKFVYKEFPLTSIHQHAMGASKAAIAAQRQGKFWEMHDKLFENYKALDAESLKKYAAEVGLDVAQWEKDLASPEVDKQVQEDMRVARAADVRGTPSMFINGKRVTNRSLEGIKEMVDATLKK